MKKLYSVFVLILISCCVVNMAAQEALVSDTEQYYDFLALQGLTERPYLNYRTLSDSSWNIQANSSHPWENQNLGSKRKLTDKIFLKIYGPELFNSFNTAAPYGQNDGALWQGKGYNGSLTGGARLEGYGVELTFKPQLAFSQNAAFDIMTPEAMTGSNFAGKAKKYGYFWGTVDAPQRFGDDPLFAFDFGDSEVRYTWKTLTVGFGTEAIWLGPAYLNPILHSNNAPTYPKFDIGLRKQRVVIPGLKWYAGDVEARIWVGYLSESNYFDNNDSNDHNMFHGLSFAYAPSFLRGLTLSVNRVCIVPWEWENLKFIFPSNDNTIEDQKMSLAVSWLFPQVGFEVFGEFGIDDYGVFFKYPFHSTVYTGGFKKQIKLPVEKPIHLEIIFEANWMEMTQDFQLQWDYDFYFHSLIKQGYTNRGQWLGNGNSHGGNSQYLRFNVYYPQGKSGLFVNRNNPDNNFIFKEGVNKSAEADNLNIKYHGEYKANVIVGIDTLYFITPSFTISGGIAYDLIMNPYYYFKDTDVEYMHNFSFQIGLNYRF
ncbi:hypothetical protein AGMMS49942_02610 [Spirochaetia bacterium]|nr:hypothetical protein AGMMS49942_02610 [Spirochaetia bacterium]